LYTSRPLSRHIGTENSSAVEMSDFDGAGVKPGVQVWRIEKMVPTPVPPETYGQFYDGDSYIVMKTTKKPNSSSLEWDIYFWLGEDSSKDEQGVAAYKTVELDEGKTGGAAVQHREVQGYESDQFMQVFKKVEYLKGGVASGFKQVKRDSYEPRLLHLKGARSVRVTTKPLAASSLNSGDVFVLDLGLKLIQWNGAEANKKEKAKALDVCLAIKDDERGGKASIDAINQGAETDAFWEALGGKGPIAPATDDAAAEKAAKGAVSLFKVSDASGSVTTTKVAEGTLKKDMLDTKDVFVMDNVAEIFVWIGKGASADERKSGMKVGDDYCSNAGRPKGTKVTKVMEGTEPTTFKSNFATWAVQAPIMPGGPAGGNVAKAGSVKSAEGLLDELSAKRQAQEQEAEVDAGDGTIDCYRIEDFKPVKVDESLEGNFYAGDSYIVSYTYKKNGKEMYMLYYWLGSQSSQDEKGAAALCTTKMDDDLGGAATQVRVVMGKEPSHFVRCFHGRMIIHSGGKASGFRNRADSDSYDKDGTGLFHIRGTDEKNTRGVQVAEVAASLNSGDCFVLQTPEVCYAWKGKGANDSEFQTAQKVQGILLGGRKEMDINEGEEPDEFWAAIGGKGEYPDARVLDEGSREPQLFSVSNSTGRLAIDPVFDFSQEDLAEEDVFILDAFTSIFLWVGNEANETEKKGALEAAAAYVKKNGYEADTPVMTVKSGSEPAIFTCYFLGWDSSEKKAFMDPYEAKLAALKAANPAEEPDVSDAPPKKRLSATAAAVFDKDFKEAGTSGYTFNYEELKKDPTDLPAGVDPRKREQYLSDADFEKVLGSPRAEFNAFKPWKQQQVKKAAGLF